MGGELTSIYGKTTGFEYLWQGNPEFWKGRAPIMFPICGRLTDGKYIYRGKEYEMNLHGFPRKMTLNVIENTSNTLAFNIKSNEETLKIYPFNFDFTIKYILKKNKIRTELIVKNTDSEKELLFSLGGHPGFNLPLEQGEDFSDAYVEFKKPKKIEKLLFSETCFYTGKNEPFPLENDKILRLKHSLFDNDAIFLSGMDNNVTLKSKGGNRFVNVRFKDMTHLGFWHAPKTEAPYMCIEPWHGVPSLDKVVDDFDTKAELMRLKAKKTYKTHFDITVSE
ncbi:MAG: aldose 1-epimerase family protein [Firmicutes bacterium]|nr:aldose 1-epimerase family protein [Candidatus Caballimonas caccae]